jgi:hypothetical protein
MRLIAARFAVCLVFAACGSRSPAAQAPPWTGESLPDQPRADLRLLAAGGEPRAPLRYEWRPGHEEDVVVEITSAMVTAANRPGGATNEIKVVPPTMRMLATVTVPDVAQDGSATVRIRIRSAEVVENTGDNPALNREMKSQLASLGDVITSMTLSPRGQARNITMQAPPDAPGNLRTGLASVHQAFAQVARFPADALGPGARWQTTSVLDTGMVTQQTSVYTLERREPGRAYLSVLITQHARRQQLPPTGLRPGSSVKLVAFEATGQAKMIVSLRSPIPRSRSAVSGRAATVVTGAGGGTMTVRTKTDVQVTIGPRRE